MPAGNSTALRTGRRWGRTAVIVTALLFAAVGIAVWSQRYSQVEADLGAIAVLPFVDGSAQSTDRPLCDGFTLELSHWLAQIPALRVVAPRSAFAFPGGDQNVRNVGKTLNSNYLLEGSLRRSGKQLRVTVQLIDARDGHRLWSAEYDQPIEDAVTLQEKIARTVANTLQVPLTPATDIRFAARRIANPAAYELFLTAQYYQRLGTPEGVRRAIDSYRQVLQADENFAPGYVGLSEALLSQPAFDRRSLGEVAAQVEPLVAAAIRLNPHSSDVYTARAALRADQYRTEESRDDLRFALFLNPNDGRAFAELGELLLRNGEPRDAALNFARAIALNPLDFRLQAQRCTALQDLAKFVEADAACQRALELAPHDAAVADALTRLAWSRGAIDAALRWNSDALKISPDDFGLYRTRAQLYLTLGVSDRARQAVESGRVASHDGESADAALVDVVFMEDGREGLRAHLNATQLDASTRVVSLLAAARGRLLLGAAAAVEDLIARAVAAADRSSDFVDTPWTARRGESCQLELAAAELDAGESAAAHHRLELLLDRLNRMMDAGVERHATYALRAKTHALLGEPEAAMQDLTRASELGWRAVWQARHEPFFTSLRSREDFQALMVKVSRSNDGLLEHAL
jgi:TolB-like protein/Tfp pilus assembly protein PilF